MENVFCEKIELLRKVYDITDEKNDWQSQDGHTKLKAYIHRARDYQLQAAGDS
jgi:hypothetical protein